MKKILVIGSSNLDMTLRCNKFPKPGETIACNTFDLSIGGKGLNQAIAANLTGASVTFLTALGNDTNKDYILDNLKEYNLNIKPVIKKTSTGNAVILVEEESKENEIIITGGANQELNKNDIDNNIELIKECDYILLQLEINIDTIKYILTKAKLYNKEVILNPAPYQYLDNDILENVTYLTPNETELESLTGKNYYMEGAKSLLDKGVKNVIVTLGSKGSVLVNKNEKIEIASHKVNAVDTTGAGDSYNGVFLGFLAQGYTVKESLSYASIAGALSVTKKGAAKSYPTKDEIINFN